MGKGVLIVSGGVLQIAALQKAKELGYTTYLSDGKETCFARPFADHFFQVDIYDLEGTAALAKRLKEEGKIEAVYTQGTDVELTVATAAAAAGLPGIPVEVARNCNDKIRMREILSQNGLNHTPFAAVKTLEELKVAAQEIGFPLYIKAVDNSASRGLTRLESAVGLEQAFEEAIKSSLHRKEVLVEAEIPGEEFSVDTVMYQGKLYPAGISDRAFQKKEKYAVQSGSRTPSLLPEKTQQEMYEVMGKAAQALGVTDGAFKGDLVVDPQGKVRIIEVTARTSGGFDSQKRKPLSFGIDILKATLDIASGKPLDPIDLIPKWVKWTSTLSVFPEPGRITAIEGLDKLKEIPGVEEVILLAKEGEIVEPYVHCATRKNYVINKADTYEELLALEAKVLETLVIRTEPL